MSVIRHEAIAQHAHKHLGLSFCQDFFERGVVSVIVENPIPGIPQVEYGEDPSPRCLACYLWRVADDILSKRRPSTIIWICPLFFAACLSLSYIQRHDHHTETFIINKFVFLFFQKGILVRVYSARHCETCTAKT